MNNKNDIDKLMKQYLGFYQKNKHQIQDSDFDKLMYQYKTKFDKQIKIQQKAMHDKENAYIQQKKQVIEKQLVTTKKTSSNFLKNETKKKSKALPIIFFSLVIIFFIIISNNYSDDYDYDSYVEYSTNNTLNEYIDHYFIFPIESDQLMNVDNLSDKSNLKNAIKYLEYIDIDELDSVLLTESSYNSLTIKNNSDYYLYLQLSFDDENESSLIIAPNKQYSHSSNSDELIIYNANFFKYTYQEPQLSTYSIINNNMSITSYYFDKNKIIEAMKYKYYQSCLIEHENEIMIIKNSETGAGYFALLDYTNQQIICYYTDDISSHDEITTENIQNYQINYFTTIIV